MTPEERLAAAAWAATQEIAGSSAHRARLDEAVAVMAPAETWNELKQAWRGAEMPTTVAPWGASADRRAEEGELSQILADAEKAVLAGHRPTPEDSAIRRAIGVMKERHVVDPLVLTGAKFQGPDLPVAAALASHRRSVLAAEADPFFGCTAGAPDWGGERPLVEQCAILPERQVTGYTPGDYERSDALYPSTTGGWQTNPALDEAIREMSDRHQRQQNERHVQQVDFFNRQIDEHGDARRLREENARLRAELRTMRAVINAALGE